LWSLPLSVPNLKRIALFVQKLLGVKNFEIGSPDLDHVHFWDVLYSLRRKGPSSIFLPNLKRIAQFVQKLLRGTRSMHAISSYRGNRSTSTQNHKPTDRTDYNTLRRLARSVIIKIGQRGLGRLRKKISTIFR